MIVYLAYSLSKKQDLIRQFSIGFIPHVLVLFMLSAFIMLQPDFGSVAILSMITWVMMFAGGVRLSHLMSSLVFILPAGIYMMMSESYRVERFFSFLNPWKYQTEGGYQVIHSLMAFGSGGLTGAGLGQGYQKLFYLPEPHTDFIFSVIGEELGGIFVLGVIALYILIIWRGIIIARKCDDLFGSLLATGLISAIGLQVVINMCVTLGLLPTKGLTLPFLSYGGTSLLVNMVAVGILMNISKAGSNG
jgi:cell division protein FtsW